MPDNNSLKEEEIYVNSLLSNIANIDNIKYILAAALYFYSYELPKHWYKKAVIPNWFVNDFFKFLLESPPYFQKIGEADIYYQYMKDLIDFYHHHILKNPDSKQWQDIAMLFTQYANFIPLYFNNANLKDIYVKRAEIMEFALKHKGHQLDYDFPRRPADRNKIRIGILSSHFSPQTETFSTIPVFEYLDRNQFEIVLYALHESHHPLEHYCRSCVDRFVKLPDNLPNQVSTIRSDDLDIILVGTNVTAVTHALTLLALHRLARIQVTSTSSCVTTGMRNIDYYISGKLTEPELDAQEQYQEKLVTVNGAAHCFNYYAIPPEPAVVTPDRTEWGITTETIVFISGANFFKIIPEIREVWAKIIASVPNSVLVLYPFNPNWTKKYHAAVPFINNFKSILSNYGVSSERLIIVNPLPSRADIKEYLKITDIYLDSYPFSGVNSLVDPLEVGLVPITLDGHSFRSLMGAALLREIGLDDLVVNDEQSYINLAIKLGTDDLLRQYYRQKIQQKMADNPPFLDSQTYSAKTGNLFKQLFDDYQTEHTVTSQNNTTRNVTADEFLNILTGYSNLYKANPSDPSAISQLRHFRKQMADFWMKNSGNRLAELYKGIMGQAHRIFLDNGFRNMPLTSEEEAFLRGITEALNRMSADTIPDDALKSLLVLMLYLPAGKLKINDADRRLPGWLLEDYRKYF